MPYDPFAVVARFAPRQPGSSDPELTAAVAAFAAESDETKWPQHYARIQARLDRLLPIVPLFAPRRIAVARRGIAVGVLEHDLYRLPQALLTASRSAR